jgi:hypothetical protein
LNNRLRKQPFLQHFEAQPQQSSPQQSSGQPQDFSHPQQSFPQQSSAQQPSLQPHEASQQQSLLQRLNRFSKQQLRLQHFFEQQQSLPQQSSPQQSSGQPQDFSQPQQSLPQQPSLQPHEASQPQLDSQDDLQRLNNRARQQVRLHLQPQQLSPQQSSLQQSSLQPQDFSQQHDGSHESQPQPLPSILSNMPAPWLWPARQTPNKSAPNRFHLIEPRLLCSRGIFVATI